MPTAVLLIAHGSRRGQANQELKDLALRMEQEGGYSIVEASFLEIAQPTIDQGAARCVERGAARIIMAPYFLSHGVHSLDDMDEARTRITEAFPSVPVQLARPLGPHPLLDALVRDRIAEVEWATPHQPTPGAAAAAGPTA